MPTTPNMNMTLPTVGVTVDPTWASNLNDALTNKVDLHDHSTGLGVPVPTAGLNINADLSFQSNDATHLRSLSLNNNVSTLPSGDIRAIYASGGNLYYNNNSGVAVQITSGASLDTGSLALNVWELTELAGNLTIPSNASYVFINTSTAVARVITLPAASAVTSGRYFIIKDKTGSANTNNITITPAGADTIDGAASSTTVTSSYGSITLVSDGVSGWLTNAAVGGFIQLGGDLLGTGSSVTAPRVSGLTGISGLVTMANNTALNTRNAANNTNVNLAKINSSNQIRLGDSSFDGYVDGTNVIVTTSQDFNVNASSDISLYGTVYGSLSTGNNGGGISTSSIYLGSGTATVGSVSISTSGGGDIALTASGAGADIGLTATKDVNITGTTATTVTATTSTLTLQASTGNTNISAAGNMTITASAGGQTMTSGLTTEITAGSTLTLTAATKLKSIGQIYVPTKAVTSSPYTVDTTTKDYVIFVDPTSGAITINLPAADNGRVLIIQDVAGLAGTNNITLVRSGSDTIQGVSANYVMDADFQGVTLVAYSGASWFIIGT